MSNVRHIVCKLTVVTVIVSLCLVSQTVRSDEPVVTVNYRVWGTADNGIDYDALSGTVTIPAGELSVVVPVTPRDDDTTEGCETANLTLIEGEITLLARLRKRRYTLRTMAVPIRCS